ncbi:hypothetical protein JN531_002345 [Flagellatimonas centrodinii]|uniref:hypothetical protein n=1 Tax=Flagellatimonas centrodinii TaxID=2806210 RepID=UPI001FFCB098|nr:hypothetical protein [Flagellatimonas centrodinii]ULQ47134.1 hypothetical protein JN531_002345 [Flagellatimonas centrodinii]
MPLSVRLQGQALTELLVVLAALIVPLMVLIRLLGGLLYQQQGMELAARYAIWERSVWSAAKPAGPGAADVVKADAVLAAEIDLRLFSHDDDEISAETPDSFRADPFLLALPGGDNHMLLRDRDEGDSVSYTAVSTSTATPAGMVGAVDSAIETLGAVTRFDLATDGITEAAVQVRLAPMQAVFELPFDALDHLQLERRAALFTGTWSAGGTAHAQHLISGLLPQQFLDNGAVDNVQQFVAYAPIAEELDSDRLRFGHVTLEPLPPARVGPQVPQP